MAMSNEEDDQERQYRYVRKYFKITKQFDELTEVIDARCAQLKRRRMSSSRKNGNSNCAGGGSSSRAAAVRGKSNPRNVSAAAASQMDHSNLLVQTINRHLEDLRSDNNPSSDFEYCSTSNN